MTIQNSYYQGSLDFQRQIKEYAMHIFRTYGRELVLRLEEYNLLQNKHNCLESSTALGFIIEEFIVSKLEMYTHSGPSEYLIERFTGATASESYDCYSVDTQSKVKYLVNIKAEQGSSKNNAIAAIGQLYKNYVETDPDQEKSYIILKIRYSIRDAYEETDTRRAKPRHLYIEELQSYCLEEVDFSQGHKQDNRSWSSKPKSGSQRNNGRLNVSDRFRADHRMPQSEISYRATCVMLEQIINSNRED